MSFDNRVWKTGLIAVVATMVLGMFVFRAAEWTRGLNGEFIAYGQTGSSGGSAGGSGVVGGGITKIIPQIAVGSYDGNITKYVTVIQVVNTGTAAISVSGNFFNQNGTPSTLAVKSNLIANPFVGTLPSTSVAGSSVMTLTADTAAIGTINWAKIVTTGAASVSAYFELRDGATNVLYNRTGIAASPSTMARFVVPRVRNVASGLDVGFALVNTGAVAANIVLTVKSNTGATLAARTFSLPAGNHMSGFPFQLLASVPAGLGCSPCLGTEAAGTSYGYLLFESSTGAFAATALAIEGPNLSSFPIEVLQ